LDTAGRWCGWAGTDLAFEAHTTLADAGLPDSAEVGPDQLGDLVVTVEPVPLPQSAPEFSAQPTGSLMARMYCFHPDGSNTAIRGVLPDGWTPPGEG
jgi:hypothetical protein